MKAAFVQFAPVLGDRRHNLERAEALVRGADADLIVLPELFSTGYFFRNPGELEGLAEPLPGGPTADALQRWAAESGAVIVAGIAEEEGGRYFNSALTVTPSGETYVYRKVHLFYQEKNVFEPGDRGFSVVEVADRAGAGYRLGVMICFDWYFPEAARSLAVQGADVIAHPSNLVRKDCPRAMPIRALENHVFTITANRTGRETKGAETLQFIGQSLICDPMGEVLVSAGREDEMVGITAFTPGDARNRQINVHNHLLRDRRVEAYRSLQDASMR